MLRNELQVRLKVNLNLLLKNQVEVLLYPVQELEQILKEEKESNPFIEEVCVSKKALELFEDRSLREPVYTPHPLDVLERNVRAELDGLDLEVALELISNVDERGFFRGDTSKIAGMFGLTEDYVEDIREFVMSLDPVGICSKDLAEFVGVQIRELYPDEPYLLKEFQRAMRGEPVGEEARRKLSHIRLSPIEEPSRVARVSKVDAVIEMDEGELVGYIYEELIDVKPNLRYMEMLRRSKGEAREFLKDYLDRLENLKKILSIRRENLKRILELILDTQEGFLKGKGNLRSLTLKETAQRLGVSESTVSRLVSSKYVKTPQGTYPFRFFFVRETVGGISQEELLREIREIVAREDRKSPLSDEEIAKILKGKGYDVARRTVTKYRELLGIPSSRERRLR